jgi:hypothetical protein
MLHVAGVQYADGGLDIFPKIGLWKARLKKYRNRKNVRMR